MIDVVYGMIDSLSYQSS